MTSNPLTYVGLLDEEPAYVRGLEAAFCARGYRPQSVADPVKWLSKTPGLRCLVVSEEPSSNLQAIERAKDFSPDVAAVALASSPAPARAISMLSHGADAIVSRRASTESIVDAVSLVLGGSMILPRATAQTIVPRGRLIDAAPSLPAPELELLLLIAEGATSASIADRLACSERTVFRKQQRLFRRLGVETRTAAVCVALKLGILPPTTE